ncbi:MAG: S8 family peptidase [Bdellovibrionales bacterium]
MKTTLCWPLSLCLFLFTQNSKAAEFSSEQVIFRLKNSIAIKETNLLNAVTHTEELVPALGIYLGYKKNNVSIGETLRQLREIKSVEYAVPDYEVSLRDMPNDPDFKLQWPLKNTVTPNADIKATEAWNYSKGGQDVSGSDIVVAVVDGGIDILHEDLRENIWVNKTEIAANGKDDDGNGYIDDVNGWNAFDDSGKLPRDAHATHVAGIVGARGNNQIQVCGVNHQVKIMSVVGASGKTSTVLKAYNYVLVQKKIWLESRGMKGANVVATNSSFGVDFADCKSNEYKPWNDIYNLMGNYGILSVAATINRNIDVDARGDVPTGCESESLIAVTNTDELDRLNTSSGYGIKSIDLGAPGTDVLSTVPGQSIMKMTGTSMATPYVAGAVALLHSAANRTFNDYYKSSPKEASLSLKKILLQNVDAIEALKDKSMSNGRLNLFKATQAISQFNQ